MSKPTRNRVMCPECFRQKMLFETQKQANNFIKWNGDDIDTNGGELRSYFCAGCGGWHITSKPYKKSYEHNTENLIKRYEKDLKLLGCKVIDVDGISKDAKHIIKSLPKEVNTKSALKKYLTSYFVENSIDDIKIQQDIRTEIYSLIKSGKFSIKTKAICDKILSDEKIMDFLKEYTIENTRDFSISLNKIIAKYNILVSKTQRKRLLNLWYEYNFKENNIEEKSKTNEDKEKILNDVYQKLITEIPEIDSPTPSFIRNIVDAFVKVNKDLYSLSAKDRNVLKGLALNYYFKDKK